MTKVTILKYILLFSFIAFYLFYTIRYSLEFRKNIIFKGRIRLFHYLMFWLIPFAWVLLIKNLSRSSKGSFEFEDKREPEPFSNPYSGP